LLVVTTKEKTLLENDHEKNASIINKLQNDTNQIYLNERTLLFEKEQLNQN
jgi:hypothetical protein